MPVNVVHVLFIVFFLTPILATTSTAKTDKQKQISFDDALSAIRFNTKLSEREKFDMQLALNKVFHMQQAKKQQTERDKQKAMEELMFRKYLSSFRKADSAFRDFHPMRFY